MKEARVIQEHKASYLISDGDNTYTATVRGSFFDTNSFPKVGDYVSFTDVSERKAVIEEILPRNSTIARNAVGTEGEQVIVANVDLIFIVMGLDKDWNVSRLERYLLLARQSDVAPVIVLNKCDQVDDSDAFVREAKRVANTTPVHAVSATTGENMEALLSYLEKDTTAVLLGSSGAGKSTITNWLMRHATQQVQAVRADDSHGRHTTTSRQLFTLPGGGYLIDTPGMRELGVRSDTENEASVFERIELLQTKCRFSNCDHEKSKGCAILAGMKTGQVSERELRNYLKLKRERLFEESKHDEETSREHKLQKKRLYKSYKQVLKRSRFERGLE